MSTRSIQLGLVEYEDALRMQHLLVAARQEGRAPDQVLLLEHPHVYTLGRRTGLEHILIEEEACRRMGVRVHRSGRGGSVTYHGPGQAVMYPILSLPAAWRNVGRYIRALEEVMLRTLGEYGIRAERDAGLPGVWVGEAKIGAVGVHMSRWVTSHGLALNVSPDLSFFEHIVPCGIRDRGVASMERLLGRPLPQAEVREALLHHFQVVFDTRVEEHPPALQTVQVIIYRRKHGLEMLSIHRVPRLGDFWQPVTGRLEAGETPDGAAAREVMEETGLSGKVRDAAYVHDFLLEPGVVQPSERPFPCFVREHTFAMEVGPGATVRLEPATHDAFRWLPVEEAIAQQRWAGNREGMRRVAAQALERGE